MNLSRPQQVFKPIKEHAHATISACAKGLRDILGHIDAMRQLTRIIQVTIIGEPYPAAFEYAPEAARPLV